MKSLIVTLVAAAALVGAPSSAQEAHEDDAEHAHPGIPASVVAFHDVMAPDWHAEAGPARFAATCENVEGYRTLVGAIAVDPPSEGVSAADWRAAANALAAAVETLDAACARESRTAFEPGFSTLHDRFHDLVALASGG